MPCFGLPDKWIHLLSPLRPLPGTGERSSSDTVRCHLWNIIAANSVIVNTDNATNRNFFDYSMIAWLPFSSFVTVMFCGNIAFIASSWVIAMMHISAYRLWMASRAST